MPRGRPRKVPQPVAESVPSTCLPDRQSGVTTQDKEAKLTDMEVLDRSLEAKREELETLDDQVKSRQMQIHSLENEMDARKRQAVEDANLVREAEMERIQKVRDAQAVKEMELDLKAHQFASREQELTQKEERAAQFEEERQKFGEFSIHIQNMTIQAQQLMEQALTMKGEYEAQLRDFTSKKLELDAQRDAQEKEAIRLSQRDGELTAWQKKLGMEQLVFEEARRALNGQAVAEAKV